MNIRATSTVALMIGLLCLSACQMAPIPQRYSSYNEGQWKAKVLLKNKRSGESNVVDLTIYAIKDHKLRMDITATLGVNVASFLMDQEHVEYVLYQKKQYFKGRRRPRVLRPLIQISMDPKVLYSIVFDFPVEAKGWSCAQDESGRVKFCRNLKSKVKIEWSDEVAGRKKIRISRYHLELEILFTDFKEKVKEKQKIFKLKIPSGFKKQT